ncbi:hypothetical protein EAH80_09585 [Mycobacterium hodleri]|uniref:Uncharacterized protein n=1 Tax=Mycolicibacterium hodleri TaxID=49897 RepID=A0A502EBJ5_9MYCO|nr:hypothetical protein EAH80_09585 [Mycolicibacterium hodleri]
MHNPGTASGYLQRRERHWGQGRAPGTLSGHGTNGRIRFTLGNRNPCWTGPIRPSLRSLTQATRMQIEIYPGWPLRYAHVIVAGLRTTRWTRIRQNDHAIASN